MIKSIELNASIAAATGKNMALERQSFISAFLNKLKGEIASGKYIKRRNARLRINFLEELMSLCILKVMFVCLFTSFANKHMF